MGIERFRNDNPRGRDEITQAYIDYLLSVDSEAAVTPGTTNYAHIRAISELLAETHEQDLQALYDAAFLQTATGVELTRNAREVGVQRRSAVAATGVVEFQRDSAAQQTYVIPAGTLVSTGGLDPIRYETTDPVTLATGETSVRATVEAVETGEQGNVGVGAIDTIVNNVGGVSTVTNPIPVGSDDHTDTEGRVLSVGRSRESDENLRERALEDTSVGGASTATAVETALENVEGVISSSMNLNTTANTVDGLDPYHSEVVVYRGQLDDIAETLKSSLSVTNLLRLQGGVNGTKETHDVYVEVLDQTVTVPITRPTVIEPTITVDVVHDGTYKGDDAVKDAVATYVGGETTGGSNRLGLAQGESIIVDEITNVIGDVRGVIATTSVTIDTDGDGTDDTETLASGLRQLTVGDSSVARADASQIVVNTTQQ